MASSQVSYQLVAYGEPLERAVIPRKPAPTGKQVLIRIGNAGCCGSDVHIMEGEISSGEKEDAIPFGLATRGLPRTLGHEPEGWVEAVGSEVRTVAPGERVVVYPWVGCGECEYCLGGEEYLCPHGAWLGIAADGAFSTHMLVPHEKYCFKYTNIAPAFAATLACSGLTAFSAIKKLGAVHPNKEYVIIGAGGLGLVALQLFRAMFPQHKGPIVLDMNDDKLRNARSNGASRTVNTQTDASGIGAISKLPITGIVDFVGSGDTVSLGYKLIKRAGKIVVVGLFGGAATIPTAFLPLKPLSIQGSYVGTDHEFRELLGLVERGLVKPPPLDIRPLSQAAQAVEDLRQGKASRGRIVLVPNEPTASL